MSIPVFPLVSEVMTNKVFAVGPDTSLETAARLLAQKRVSGAPVVDDGGEVIGVVSASDIVDPDRERGGELGNAHYYSLESGYADEFGDPSVRREGTVREVMTPTVLSIGPSDSIVEAGRMMVSKGVHRLLVVDEQLMLAGIISVTDIVRGFVQAPGLEPS
ncbi:inosine 5'-monophosphate dehydrogenase [Enhygromyxa salina]|uniref:Inosine 5'-monophosphate dehydrogenase n=1 Tax=Enhygromyxa salina TaxID=215803 RepID=A0A2S9YBP0_9BACT|nr:CBS domain-containing protein [Enhygromyxa salina]PRQ02520.1 inosine 5'-monophosphate dehydrogenase [Enhygromyxa salina]